MFGPQMEQEFQVITFNNQQLFKQLERERMARLAVACKEKSNKANDGLFTNLIGWIASRQPQTASVNCFEGQAS
jgi:hypothetical protein